MSEEGPERMIHLANMLFLLIALGCSIPMVVLYFECFSAIWPGQHSEESGSTPIHADRRPQVAVIVPAHNEASGIAATLKDLLPQLGSGDRLMVIADNCTDQTAEVARSFAATVLERFDPDHRGKGYALAHGISSLRESPPDVVVIVDADCSVQSGAIARIAQLAFTSGHPVQSRYVMMQPAQPTPKDAVSALAFLVKNWVRLQGLALWGLPSLLTGTGMAFPWNVIENAPLASGNIVEDMQLGLDLAVAGHPPLFCAEAVVLGRLPDGASVAKTQRTRWEHGHMRTLLTQVPRLLTASVRQRRLDLLAIALDLCVPPLSLLVMLWLLLAGLSILIGSLTAFWLPAAGLALEGLLLTLAVGASWFKFGRDQIPARVLLMAPAYILWKIPLYMAFLVRPQTRWIRTERN